MTITFFGFDGKANIKVARIKSHWLSYLGKLY